MSVLARVAQSAILGARKSFAPKYPIMKFLSTQAEVAEKIPPQIPSNLHMINVNVLDEVDEKIYFNPELFMFPPLHIPTSTAVTMFHNPGHFTETEAPLQKMIFGVAIRKDIVHEVIRYQRAKVRQPKKTKRMSEIRGSNKKPRPQKGGGSAQVGHKRNSVWRGGQKAHGPVLRDYSFSLNRKFRAMGLMIALTAKFREGNMIVFDKIHTDSHKTKDLKTLLAAHGLANKSVLIVEDEFDDNFLLAVANSIHVTPLPQRKTNVYDLVRREKLCISASALSNIQARLNRQYTHKGKMESFSRDLNTYLTAANAEEGEFDEDSDDDEE